MQPSLQYSTPHNPSVVWGEKYSLQDNNSPKHQRKGCKILRESLSRVTPGSMKQVIFQVAINVCTNNGIVRAKEIYMTWESIAWGNFYFYGNAFHVHLLQ